MSRVSWAEGQLALDLHTGDPVRVVAMGTFGNLHAEGVLRPSERPGPSDDHAFYELVTNEYKPFPVTLIRNEDATCEITEAALMIEYPEAVIRVLWADLETGGRRRSLT